MDITTPDGRTLGHVRMTPADIASLAGAVGDSVELRARAMIADARRNAAQRTPIASGSAATGGWTPGPTAGQGVAPTKRRRRWWPWIAGVLLALTIIGALSDGGEDTAPATPAPAVGAVTVAPQPTDVTRAVPAADGSILVGDVVIDNVFDEGSPLRERFAGVITQYGATGTTGTELDANLKQGIAFCRALAVGDVTAQRHADVVTGVADKATAYGVGKQRRAIVTASLATLCPAL